VNPAWESDFMALLAGAVLVPAFTIAVLDRPNVKELFNAKPIV
jgi:hypothetical protein